MFDTPFDAHDDRSRRSSEEEVQLDENPLYDQASPPPPLESRLGRRRWWALAGLVLVVVMSWYFLRSDDAPAAAPAPPTVTVATPLQMKVTEWDEFIGRFEASRSVEIRPRVSGQITAVHFTDGQFVRSGAPLFTIDPRPYRASLAEAQARVVSASSALELSRSNLARAQRLVEEDAVAATEIDRLQAEVRANEAALAAAQAAVRSRSLDVEFTTVRAPISGRISDRRVDPGNLVAAGSGDAATLLTTINALDPIYFTFDGSEGLFLKARREGLGNSAPVEIRLQDEADYRWHGTLDFTDNGLDPRSGTIRARAVISNADGFLAPGLFGNMRMATGGTSQALLVPDAAIVTDQTRKLVLVVGDDGTVATREVELGPLANGLRVVRSGIAARDRVVIQGVQMAIPGQQVQPEDGEIAAVEASAEPQVERSSAPAGSATIAD